MVTSRTCDKCKHFTPPEPWRSVGQCEETRDYNDFDSYPSSADRAIEPNRAYGWDYEGSSAGIYVGPKFGCLHWTKA